MKNSKKISKRAIFRITVLLILLAGFIYPAPPAMAIPAQAGDRAILGREVNNGLIEEMIILTFKPGEYDNVRSEIESGAKVIVLDKSELETGTFYLVIEIVEGIGRMGWVAEDYIHEITERPKF